jgi:hypothetical protein
MFGQVRLYNHLLRVVQIISVTQARADMRPVSMGAEVSSDGSRGISSALRATLRSAASCCCSVFRPSSEKGRRQ